MRLRLVKMEKPISKEKKEAILANLGYSAFLIGEPKFKLKIINLNERRDDENITKY